MRELNNDNIKVSSVNYHNLLLRFMQVFIGLGFLTVIYLALHTIIVEGKSLVVPTVSLGELGLFISIFVGVILIRTFFNIAEYKSSHIKNLSEYQILQNKRNEHNVELNRIFDEIEELQTKDIRRLPKAIERHGNLLATITFASFGIIIPYLGLEFSARNFNLSDSQVISMQLIYMLFVASIAIGYNVLLIEVIKNFRTKSRALIGLFSLFLLSLSSVIIYSALGYPFSPFGITCMIIASVVSSLISGSSFHSFYQSDSEKIKWLNIEANKIQTKINECEGRLNSRNAEQTFKVIN
jgi:hypothetical protein